MSKASQLAEAPDSTIRPDGRREKRYQQPGVKVTIQVLPDGTPEEVALRDISLHGFGIDINRYLEPGTPVLIRARKQRIEAEIVYCLSEGDAYRAGISVRHATREQAAPKRNWESLLAGSVKR